MAGDNTSLILDHLMEIRQEIGVVKGKIERIDEIADDVKDLQSQTARFTKMAEEFPNHVQQVKIMEEQFRRSLASTNLRMNQKVEELRANFSAGIEGVKDDMDEKMDKANDSLAVIKEKTLPDIDKQLEIHRMFRTTKAKILAAVGVALLGLVGSILGRLAVDWIRAEIPIKSAHATETFIMPPEAPKLPRSDETDAE